MAAIERTGGSCGGSFYFWDGSVDEDKGNYGRRSLFWRPSIVSTGPLEIKGIIFFGVWGLIVIVMGLVGVSKNHRYHLPYIMLRLQYEGVGVVRTCHVLFISCYTL